MKNGIIINFKFHSNDNEIKRIIDISSEFGLSNLYSIEPGIRTIFVVIRYNTRWIIRYIKRVVDITINKIMNPQLLVGYSKNKGIILEPEISIGYLREGKDTTGEYSEVEGLHKSNTMEYGRKIGNKEGVKGEESKINQGLTEEILELAKLKKELIQNEKATLQSLEESLKEECFEVLEKIYDIEAKTIQGLKQDKLKIMEELVPIKGKLQELEQNTKNDIQNIPVTSIYFQTEIFYKKK